MTSSADMSQKSISAAVGAIELYNKPSLHYREESFCLLLVNAWELLLKAKWLKDHNEDADSLTVIGKDGSIKLTRSKTPFTHSLDFLAKRIRESSSSGFDTACEANLMALVEIRDTAVHLMNTDLYLARRVLEIGSASLHNYLELARDWFGLDLSSYNFFIMPMSFFHGFQTVKPVSSTHYPKEVAALLEYFDSLESGSHNAIKPFALRIETKMVRSKQANGAKFQLTAAADAPLMTLKEEDIRENYPLDYKTVLSNCKTRYANFSQDKHFHAINRELKQDLKYAFERSLDPKNPKSPKKWFYSHAVWNKFDESYQIQGKLAVQGQMKSETLTSAPSGQPPLLTQAQQ